MPERFALALSHGLGPTIAARVADCKNASVICARLGQDPRMRVCWRGPVALRRGPTTAKMELAAGTSPK
jgi:hypothetical protein